MHNINVNIAQKELIKFKNVHYSFSKIPSTACKLASVKKLEEQLISKSIINKDDFFPLWFQAEQEVNIYLWKKKFSLSDKEMFEFWIDLPKLINKRLNKLKNENSINPFFNASFDLNDEPKFNENTIREKKYLLGILETMHEALLHLNSLSIAIHLLEMEENPENYRDIIVLPS